MLSEIMHRKIAEVRRVYRHIVCNNFVATKLSLASFGCKDHFSIWLMKSDLRVKSYLTFIMELKLLIVLLKIVIKL